MNNSGLIYYSQGFWTYNYGSFTKYTMNNNYLLKEEEKLEIFIILDSGEMNTLPNEVRKALPNVSKEGCYFKVTTFMKIVKVKIYYQKMCGLINLKLCSESHCQLQIHIGMN